jgi:XTP/dITP diphosphohydrolase
LFVIAGKGWFGAAAIAAEISGGAGGSMQLILSTNNQHKLREIQALLEGGPFSPILSMQEAGLFFEVEETGSTFEENALLKAQAVMQASGCAALADDSGLEVDALDGRPGVLSARFAGMHGDDEANNQMLLKQLAAVPYARRTARYRCALALVRPNLPPLVAEGSCEGIVLNQGKGQGGFGYDPLFYMPDQGQTMAELAPKVKNSLSHRYLALVALKNRLAQEP